MAIITPDESGSVGGFEKFPEGDSVVLFNDLKFHVKDNETKPLVMWLVWNHIDNELMQVSQYIDFSKPRGIKDFVTALRISGVADKMKKQYSGLFGGASGYDIDDDRILDKVNGIPVKVKDNFVMAVRTVLSGTVVGVHVETDKKNPDYVNIKRYIPMDKMGSSSGSSSSSSSSGSGSGSGSENKQSYSF